MADKTSIEWTDASWNPIRGCTVVSAGCKNCYAMQVAARFSGEGQAYEGLAYRNESGAHWTGKVRLIEERLQDPIRWKRPRRIFVNSMSDLFHEDVSNLDIERVFNVMYNAPQHTFQILTKRPQRMHDYLNSHRGWWGNYPQWQHVWLGVSVEDQRSADERIPLLLQTPAAVRWLSIEPLLDKVDLYEAFPALGCSNDDPSLSDIHWVVCGGESGHGARPMHPDWVRSLRDQCVEAGVPFFFKQHGNWIESLEENHGALVSYGGGHTVVSYISPYELKEAIKSGSTLMRHVGKKAAGRQLDGREWNEMPETL